jgi:acetyl esterase/lipase
MVQSDEGVDEHPWHGVVVLLRSVMDNDGRVDAMRGYDMRRVAVLLAAVGMLATGCSSGTSDTTLVTTTSTVSTTVPSTTTTSQAITTTAVPSTTTTTAATITVAAAPLEAKYPVVVTSGLSGEDTQQITVWTPDADGSWPVVYALHGTGGNAQDLAETATILAGQGVVVFAADYRSELIQTTQWKDVYRDSECGYRYARSVAADYGGDLDQPVTIVGHSLGASIALTMGLNEKVFGPDGEFDSCPGVAPRPDVVVPLSGCHYEYEGRTFAFDPEAVDLTYDESELVLVVGTEDDVCELWQSEDAATALRDDGFDTSLVTIDGGNHFTVTFHDLVGGEWLTLPDDPAGMEVVQTILNVIEAAQ